MKREIIQCDRCLKTLTVPAVPYVIVIVQTHHPTTLHLCSGSSKSCYEQFKNWLKER